MRYVKTRQKALGYGVVPSTVSGVNYQTISATTATRSYTDVPPASERGRRADRGSAAALRRGQGDVASELWRLLTPGVNISTGSNKTVTSGNPFLDLYRAKIADAAIEWYFQPGALLSLAYFYKDISTSSVQSYTSPPSTFDKNPSTCRTAPRLRLAAHAGLLAQPAGLAVQHLGQHAGRSAEGLRDQLPAAVHLCRRLFDKFGFLGNYTHVTSNVTYLSSTGVVAAVGPLDQPVEEQLQRHALLREQEDQQPRFGRLSQQVPDADPGPQRLRTWKAPRRPRTSTPR
ncbi:hypothetical protein ACRAWD_18715 [Caulobacter segnis]